MPVELKIPQVGESIQEVQIGRWLKQPGQRVERDENVVEIETDKASVELPSPVSGVMGDIVKREGEVVAVGEVIAYVLEGEAAAAPPAAPAPRAPSPPPAPQPALSPPPAPRPPSTLSPPPKTRSSAPRATAPTVTANRAEPAPTPLAPSPQPLAPPPRLVSGELEEVVPMSQIRRRIAARLVEAQHTAALLTTFNEIDMTAVMQLRQQFKDVFQEQHGIKLGFMSFFVKAVVDGLKRCPELNAEIRDNSIVYRNFYDIGVAIGGGKGLVVPILRRAELMSFAQIELTIADFARRAADNKIAPEDLVGGTFTITNGGVYGSLLSTPIVNPPQSGILGMHAIQDRPIARNGQVVIRPMMYIALTYDHRIVDGREAVGFVKRIKEVIEEPSRMLMEI